MGEDKPLSIFQKRWRKFKTLKRGWYSFVFLTVALLLSFFNPILINNRALVVHYDGSVPLPRLRKGTSRRQRSRSAR